VYISIIPELAFKRPVRSQEFSQDVIASDPCNTELRDPAEKVGEDRYGNGGKGLLAGVVTNLNDPQGSCNHLSGIVGCTRVIGPCSWDEDVAVKRICRLAISHFLSSAQAVHQQHVGVNKQLGRACNNTSASESVENEA